MKFNILFLFFLISFCHSTFAVSDATAVHRDTLRYCDTLVMKSGNVTLINYVRKTGRIIYYRSCHSSNRMIKSVSSLRIDTLLLNNAEKELIYSECDVLNFKTGDKLRVKVQRLTKDKVIFFNCDEEYGERSIKLDLIKSIVFFETNDVYESSKFLFYDKLYTTSGDTLHVKLLKNEVKHFVRYVMIEDSKAREFSVNKDFVKGVEQNKGPLITLSDHYISDEESPKVPKIERRTAEKRALSRGFLHGFIITPLLLVLLRIGKVSPKLYLFGILGGILSALIGPKRKYKDFSVIYAILFFILAMVVVFLLASILL